MNITTAFNQGDTVWVIDIITRQPAETTVDEIEVKVNESSTTIRYLVTIGIVTTFYNENSVYSSLENLSAGMLSNL